MKTKRLFLILIIPLILSGSGCSAFYPDITGTVVDAETGHPIEGAIVLVEWTKRVGVGDYRTESVKVVEVVTEKDGRFKVSGLIKPFVQPPDMTVYKKGYVAWNNKSIFPSNNRREDFKWQNGVDIKLDIFGDKYSREKHEDFITLSIGSWLNPESKKKMIEAFEWETDLAFQERMIK